MPLPLPMMIPFMAAQSAALALAFGEGFQYGKRRISAMSNAEFNALTPEILFNRQQLEISKMIPSLKDSMRTYSESMTPAILELFGVMIQKTLERVGEQVTKGTDSALEDLAHTLGTHYGHETTTVTPSPPPPEETTTTTGGTSPGDTSPHIQTTDYPYTYESSIPSDSSWNWLTKEPFKISLKTIKSLDTSFSAEHYMYELRQIQKIIDEFQVIARSKAFQTTTFYNMTRLRFRHHEATGNWV